MVQLKSTNKGSDRPRVRIRSDTYDYYRSLDLPVLIALYEADRDRLLVRWFHEFDPFYGGVGKSGITFRFGKEHAWTNTTASRLRSDLQTLRVLRNRSLPRPIPVQVQVESEHVGGVSKARIELVLRRELWKLRGIFKETDSDAPLQITVDAGKTVASFRGRYSISLHYGNELVDADHFARDVLLLVSNAIAQIGDHSLAATIASRFAGKSKLMRIPEMAFLVGRSMIQAGQIPLLLDVAGELMEDVESRSIADGLMVAALIGEKESGRTQPYVETHLRQKIALAETGDDSIQLGTTHYNLANWLRGQERYREALRHYRIAAAIYPAYAERDYYYREIGSLLFGAGFYTASARLYNEAVNRGGLVAWKALHADALMLAGSFAAARKAFDRYLQAEIRPDPEWVLKRWVLNAMETLQLPDSGRRPREAMCLLQEDESSDESVLQALGLDPLCAEAWLRLGEAEMMKGNDELSAVGAVAGAVIAGGDPRLWAQAFVCSTGRLADAMGELIAFAAIYRVGDAFAESVREFAERNSLPDEMLDVLLDVVTALEADYARTRTPDSFEVRIGGQDADYESMVVLFDEPPEEGTSPQEG